MMGWFVFLKALVGFFWKNKEKEKEEALVSSLNPTFKVYFSWIENMKCLHNLD